MVCCRRAAVGFQGLDVLKHIFASALLKYAERRYSWLRRAIKRYAIITNYEKLHRKNGH